MLFFAVQPLPEDLQAVELTAFAKVRCPFSRSTHHLDWSIGFEISCDDGILTDHR